MKKAMTDYEERVAEVDDFFRLLTAMAEPSSRIHFGSKQTHKYQKIEESWLRLLKATAFLVLYNLVEASLRNALRTMYEQMKNEGCTYAKVTVEFRKIWFDQQYKPLDLFSSSPQTYHGKAYEMITGILDNLVVELSEQRLPVSGNLDADLVRKVCRKHGVSVSVHHAAKGGSRLSLIKKQRNALAHGDSSFAECGRQYTVQDLIGIKNETVIFMRSILRNVSKFAARRSYRVF